MFGKMMNNFYYGKSGKGDFKKEDLPRTRWQLFWEMLRIRLSALCAVVLRYSSKEFAAEVGDVREQLGALLE